MTSQLKSLNPECLLELWKVLLVPRNGLAYAEFPLLQLVESSSANEATFASFLRAADVVLFGTDFIRLVYDQPYMGIKESTVVLKYRCPAEAFKLYNIVTKYTNSIEIDY